MSIYSEDFGLSNLVKLISGQQTLLLIWYARARIHWETRSTSYMPRSERLQALTRLSSVSSSLLRIAIHESTGLLNLLFFSIVTLPIWGCYSFLICSVRSYIQEGGTNGVLGLRLNQNLFAASKEPVLHTGKSTYYCRRVRETWYAEIFESLCLFGLSNKFWN